jgi:hypothetical protein
MAANSVPTASILLNKKMTTTTRVEQVGIVQEAVNRKNNQRHYEHKRQVRYHLAKVNGGTVYGGKQQPIEATAILLNSQGTV